MSSCQTILEANACSDLNLPTPFCHYTDHAFCPGDAIVPMVDGFVDLPEATALETILERYRPDDKLPRADAVFLFLAPAEGSCNFGAAGDRFICTCQPESDPLPQRSDLRWISELDQGFEDRALLEEDFSESELAYLGGGYWSGRPRPGYEPHYEYRVTSAAVVSCAPHP